jgi:hypothetical protein
MTTIQPPFGNPRLKDCFGGRGSIQCISLAEWLNVDRRIGVRGLARAADIEFPRIASGVDEADHSLICQDSQQRRQTVAADGDPVRGELDPHAGEVTLGINEPEPRKRRPRNGDVARPNTNT